MKRKLFFVVLILSSRLVFSQTTLNPGFGNGSSAQEICGNLAFASDEEVNALVDKILEYANVINRSYEIKGCNNAKGCFAIVRNNQQYIVYQPDYLKGVSSYGFTNTSLPDLDKDWQALTILAHEVGHLINSHFYNCRQDLKPWDKELQADEFAGRILYQMNGSLSQAQSVYYTSIVSEAGSMSHPPRKDRLASVTKGYNNAKRLFPKQIDNPVQKKEEPYVPYTPPVTNNDQPIRSGGKGGYHIRLQIPDTRAPMVYLLHYYGKGRPTIFKSDSAYFDKNGNAEFKSTDESFVGGIYVMLLSDRSNDFEFLLNKGDDITIRAQLGKLPDGIVFGNSPENDRFEEYVRFLKEYSRDQEILKKELDKARTDAETTSIRNRSVAQSKKLTDYRRDYIRHNPGTLLAGIFNAMETPEVPSGPHYLPDGYTKDSTFAYKYYKSHFWDGFNFRDDRLVFTPLLDSKLEEYFNRLVVQSPDSVSKEADMLLRKTKGTKDMFHYFLWWITRYTENSKTMGMDEAFVYLVENYYMKGDAFWLSSDELPKYIDRARKIAPNVIGNLAPGISLPNVITNQQENMLDLKSKYTMVVFYGSGCGHCKTEIPQLYSLYQSTLKAKGVKVFTVATEGSKNELNNFISQYNMGEWTNTWDPDRTGDFRSKYDVYSTPTIYLLDERKVIKGKRLDHSNVLNLIETLDRKR